MSLLKWKEMAEKRSELGQRINEVRKTIKQKSISDQIGQVEAAKLFEPITSGLKDITAPKAPLRRLKKRGPVPDYELEIIIIILYSFNAMNRRYQRLSLSRVSPL